MTKDLVQAIGPEFTAFLRPFERFFDNPGTVQHFRNYTRGLLTSTVSVGAMFFPQTLCDSTLASVALCGQA